jgi:uncharacterized damage-inducible protein DinB
MKNEIRAIVESIHSLMTGHPWFGRNAQELLGEVSPELAYTKPGEADHSLCDLLWHMNTWAQFTVNRIQGSKKKDAASDPSLDWRKTGPRGNTWDKGMKEFTAIHKKIITLLRDRDDAWLDKKVDFREYNFRFLLHGMIQHDIYHLGQIAYLNKLLSN